jgi:chromosome segregation ATPase
MSRPRLFSFFSRAPELTAILPPSAQPVIVAGITSEPPNAEIASLTAQLAAVTAERDIVQSDNTALVSKFTEIEAKFNEAGLQIEMLNANATALNTVVESLSAERDTLKAENARTRDEITQEVRNREMATLAASQGIPAGTEIVPANGADQSKDEQIEALIVTMKAERDPVKKGKICDQIAVLRSSK